MACLCATIRRVLYGVGAEISPQFGKGFGLLREWTYNGPGASQSKLRGNIGYAATTILAFSVLVSSSNNSEVCTSVNFPPSAIPLLVRDVGVKPTPKLYITVSTT
ncbi:hypothetical protein HAX54_020187 [Datura stramonium]|uniref:Uncharacterized protein n=1 Tax=Datura stramonium TaxID=4076 RepID=A0ABS8UQJ2_DATST|nr:hypothetical protein [Datura stramonium]